MIKTERLILRAFKLSDAEDVFEYCQNENVGKTQVGNFTKALKRVAKLLEIFFLTNPTSLQLNLVEKSSDQLA